MHVSSSSIRICISCFLGLLIGCTIGWIWYGALLTDTFWCVVDSDGQTLSEKAVGIVLVAESTDPREAAAYERELLEELPIHPVRRRSMSARARASDLRAPNRPGLVADHHPRRRTSFSPVVRKLMAKSSRPEGSEGAGRAEI